MRPHLVPPHGPLDDRAAHKSDEFEIPPCRLNLLHYKHLIKTGHSWNSVSTCSGTKARNFSSKSFLSAIQGGHDFSQNFLPIMCPKALSRMMFLLVPYSIIVNWLSVPNPCVFERERERERESSYWVCMQTFCLSVCFVVYMSAK